MPWCYKHLAPNGANAVSFGRRLRFREQAVAQMMLRNTRLLPIGFVPALLVFFILALAFSQLVSSTATAQTSKKKGITRRQVGRANAPKTDDAKQLDMMIDDAEGGWDTVVHSPTSILKYHPQRVTWDTAQMASVWLKEYVKRPLAQYRQKEIQRRIRLGLSTKGYDRYTYSLTLWQLTCDSSQMRVLSFADYDADGNVIDSNSGTTRWDRIVPDSTGDAVLSKVCSSRFDELYSDATAPKVHDWRFVASSEEMNFYYDVDGISRSEAGSTKMWQKWEVRSDTAAGRRALEENVSLLTKPIGEARAQTYKYDVLQIEYRCSQGMAREVRWLIYDTSNNLLIEFQPSREWAKPEPGGSSERMMRIACPQ